MNGNRYTFGFKFVKSATHYKQLQADLNYGMHDE